MQRLVPFRATASQVLVADCPAPAEALGPGMVRFKLGQVHSSRPTEALNRQFQRENLAGHETSFSGSRSADRKPWQLWVVCDPTRGTRCVVPGATGPWNQGAIGSCRIGDRSSRVRSKSVPPWGDLTAQSPWRRRRRKAWGLNGDHWADGDTSPGDHQPADASTLLKQAGELGLSLRHVSTWPSLPAWFWGG